MARPKKQTVDYFTHDCDCLNKKTLYIIENRFGNNGYAFWFKLLEILGTTDGHYYNCNDSSTWEFLLTKTRLNGVSATEILDMLAKLGAIDKDLWEIRVIWSQNFVDRLNDVYSKRLIDKPIKPEINSFRIHKPNTSDISVENNNASDVNSPQDDIRNPQTKLKESKVNNNIPDSEDNSDFELFEGVFEESPSAAHAEQKKKSYKTKHSQEDIKIHNDLAEEWQKTHGKFFSFIKESEGLYRLIKYSRIAAPDLPVFDFVLAAREEFLQQKNAGEKIFINQPCVPSIVSSGGLWPQVIERMKQKNLIRGSPINGESQAEYFRRTMKGVFESV